MVSVSGLPSWNYRGHLYAAAEWFEGLVYQESVGEPRARRYEPHQDRASRMDAPSDPDICDHDDGELEDDASYGLTQIMGYTARALVGVERVTLRGGKLVVTDPGIYPPMRFGWLFRPLTNLSLGLRLLHEELQAVQRDVSKTVLSPGDEIARALCRYNGGSTGDNLVDGDLRLRAYADRVAARAALVRADRPS